MKNKFPSNKGRCRGYVWKPEVQDVVDTSDVLQAGQSCRFRRPPFGKQRNVTNTLETLDMDLLPKMLGTTYFFQQITLNAGFFMVILNPCWKNFVKTSTIKQVQKWSWDPRMEVLEEWYPSNRNQRWQTSISSPQKPHEGIMNPTIVSQKMIPLKTNMAMEHHQIFKLHLQMFVFSKSLFSWFLFFHCHVRFSGGVGHHWWIPEFPMWWVGPSCIEKNIGGSI